MKWLTNEKQLQVYVERKSGPFYLVEEMLSYLISGRKYKKVNMFKFFKLLRGFYG